MYFSYFAKKLFHHSLKVERNLYSTSHRAAAVLNITGNASSYLSQSRLVSLIMKFKLQIYWQPGSFSWYGSSGTEEVEANECYRSWKASLWKLDVLSVAWVCLPWRQQAVSAVNFELVLVSVLLHSKCKEMTTVCRPQDDNREQWSHILTAEWVCCWCRSPWLTDLPCVQEKAASVKLVSEAFVGAVKTFWLNASIYCQN